VVKLVALYQKVFLDLGDKVLYELLHVTSKVLLDDMRPRFLEILRREVFLAEGRERERWLRKTLALSRN
jgi:hypothetical protein